MIGRVFLGRYEAKRLLGEGGMGQVYLAREYNPDRYVVVKVMREHLRDDAPFVERFSRETRTMARFRHPHSVALLDASLDDPLGPCIVMEYIKGIGLDQLLEKNRRFTPARTGRFISQLCDVLQCAHDLGIIHRDLKPANLMVVNADTPNEQIKVMDFGLAKEIYPLVAAKVSTDTQDGFAIGTPKYISPEQIRGESPDPRGDLYSVGVIAYELLSGQLPFDRAAQMDMILAHAIETPPTFEELGMRRWVSRSVEQVVFACLEKDPQRRPQSARELADRLNAAIMQVDHDPAEAPATRKSASTVPIESDAISFQFDAWMPRRIAVVKLRGFVHDHGGEVIDSEPGLIRVRLAAKSQNTRDSMFSSWLGLRRQKAEQPGQEIELRLQVPDSRQESRLQVTVLFRPPAGTSPHDFAWREHCSDLFCEARAYLMGNTKAS